MENFANLLQPKIASPATALYANLATSQSMEGVSMPSPADLAMKAQKLNAAKGESFGKGLAMKFQFLIAISYQKFLQFTVQHVNLNL